MAGLLRGSQGVLIPEGHGGDGDAGTGEMCSDKWYVTWCRRAMGLGEERQRDAFGLESKGDRIGRGFHGNWVGPGFLRDAAVKRERGTGGASCMALKVFRGRWNGCPVNSGSDIGLYN
jgi:hypothetical protein